MTSIGASAFEYCINLTSIIIPSNVSFMGSWTFSGCSGLTSIISLIENPFPVIGKESEFTTFDVDIFNKVILYVPKGTLDKYKETEGWKDFVNIKENTTDGIDTPMLIQAEDCPVYDLQGRRMADYQPLHPGIYVKDGRKFVVK